MKRTASRRSVDMSPRAVYLRTLARDVATGAIGASQAVVLSYQYDHPGMTVTDAAAAVGVPVVCVRDLPEMRAAL